MRFKDKAFIYDLRNTQRFPLTAVKYPEGPFHQTQLHPEFEGHRSFQCMVLTVQGFKTNALDIC